MRAKICKACRQAITDADVVCPNCGAELPPKAGDLSFKQSAVGCIGCLGVVALVALVLTVACPGEKSNSPRMRRMSALTRCESEVSEKLRAPATAVFGHKEPLDAAVTVQSDSATTLVEGWVDSENGFGAKLRVDYQCLYYIIGDTIMTLGVQLKPR